MARRKEPPGRYAMLSHTEQGSGNPEVGFAERDEWKRMDAHRSPEVNRVWQPRQSREAAVSKCLHWTGMVCIPPMRVVDLETGAVLWQRAWPPSQYRTGPDLVPGWAATVEAQVAAELAEEGRLVCREETGQEIGYVLEYLAREGEPDDHADDPKYRWRPYNRTEPRLGCEVGWDSDEPSNGPWTRRIRGCVWGAAEVLLGDWRLIRDHLDLLLDLEVTYQAHKHDPALAHPKGGIDPAVLADRHRRHQPAGVPLRRGRLAAQMAALTGRRPGSQPSHGPAPR